MEFTELRILSQLSAGKNVGPESSLLKCRGTELQQQLTELVLEATGNYAVPFDNPGPETGQNELPIDLITPMSQHPNISIPERCRSTQVQTRSSETSWRRWCWGCNTATFRRFHLTGDEWYMLAPVFCFSAINQKSAGHQIATGQNNPAKVQQRLRLKIRMPLL